MNVAWMTELPCLVPLRAPLVSGNWHLYRVRVRVAPETTKSDSLTLIGVGTMISECIHFPRLLQQVAGILVA